MIDSKGFRLVYLISAALFLAALGVAIPVWNSLSIAGGLALGFVMGLLPVASWQFASGVVFKARAKVAWVVILLIAKMGFYGAAFYFLIHLGHVNGVATAVGLTLVPMVLPLVFLARPNPAGQVS